MRKDLVIFPVVRDGSWSLFFFFCSVDRTLIWNGLLPNIAMWAVLKIILFINIIFLREKFSKGLSCSVPPVEGKNS